MAYAKINGIKIFYDFRTKKNSKETVVFFNGVASSTESWDKQVSVLENFDFNILLHDFRGQLKSDKPVGKFTFDNNVEDTKKLLDYLNIKKVHIVAMSHGAIVALRFALKYSECVNSLTIINSLPKPDGTMKLLDKIAIKLLSGDTPDGKAYISMVLFLAYSENYINNNSELLDQKISNCDKLGEDFFLGQKAFCEMYIEDEFNIEVLRKIVCPVLIIGSEKDRLTPIRYANELYELLPHAEYVVVQDSGHSVLIEKPDVINSLILGFLAKNIWSNNK